MTYMARFEGGPLDGTTAAHPGPWPLPGFLEVDVDKDGAYRKVSESQLAVDVPHVARGAIYRWVAHDHDHQPDGSDIEVHLGIPHGICRECGETIWAVGPEDEAGQPGWELVDA